MIELQQLNKHYALGGQVVKALDNVSLTIVQGEYLSVMGPSGSGKSTLLNALGLLDRPTSGHLLLDGVETTPLSDQGLTKLRADKIGFVFQSYHLIPRLTARENIELPMMLAGISKKQRSERAKELAQRLGIEQRIDHLPNQLSGGQRQRVAIARSITMKPRLLLADEPTGNLDSTSGTDVIHLLEELNEQGITLVVVTHDKNIGNRAKRQLVMVDGKIHAEKFK
ncbi:MAG: ABC transporter ATP-binding protein [Gammaproteobacteria bacterium]|nr:ABC transporter ATP-binding protein [Gammaproteobacteria bacterium]